jgi:hypothetical protein
MNTINVLLQRDSVVGHIRLDDLGGEYVGRLRRYVLDALSVI